MLQKRLCKTNACIYWDLRPKLIQGQILYFEKLMTEIFFFRMLMEFPVRR